MCVCVLLYNSLSLALQCVCVVLLFIFIVINLQFAMKCNLASMKCVLTTENIYFESQIAPKKNTIPGHCLRSCKNRKILSRLNLRNSLNLVSHWWFLANFALSRLVPFSFFLIPYSSLLLSIVPFCSLLLPIVPFCSLLLSIA